MVESSEQYNRQPETLEEALQIIDILAAANRRLQEEARQDVLIKTMLNKRAMEARVAERIDKKQPFGLFLIDLNNFNTVNNTFGHAFGDRVLLRFGELLNEALKRRTDEFNLISNEEISDQGRIGGDEFIVTVGLFQDWRREEDPQKQMDKVYELLRTVEAALLKEFPELEEIGFGLAIGSTVYDISNPVHPSVLLAQADEAMYEEKGEKARLKERAPPPRT
jgi:diguanylate cyclase (GGDEF)-like protein